MNIKTRLTIMNFLEFAVWGLTLPLWVDIWVLWDWEMTFRYSMLCRGLFLSLCPLFWVLWRIGGYPLRDCWAIAIYYRVFLSVWQDMWE